jgi:hypothetical protein
MTIVEYVSLCMNIGGHVSLGMNIGGHICRAIVQHVNVYMTPKGACLLMHDERWTL